MHAELFRFEFTANIRKASVLQVSHSFFRVIIGYPKYAVLIHQSTESVNFKPSVLILIIQLNYVSIKQKATLSVDKLTCHNGSNQI